MISNDEKKKKRKKNRRRELIWGKEILLVCAVENEREGERGRNGGKRKTEDGKSVI